MSGEPSRASVRPSTSCILACAPTRRLWRPMTISSARGGATSRSWRDVEHRRRLHRVVGRSRARGHSLRVPSTSASRQVRNETDDGSLASVESFMPETASVGKARTRDSGEAYRYRLNIWSGGGCRRKGCWKATGLVMIEGRGWWLEHGER